MLLEVNSMTSGYDEIEAVRIYAPLIGAIKEAKGIIKNSNGQITIDDMIKALRKEGMSEYLLSRLDQFLRDDL
jgi:hypothetical protein